MNQFFTLGGQSIGASAMQETQVQSLGWEDSPGEGNSNPFQYVCLGNPMDRILSMEFSRQGYWSKLLFSTSGDLPHSGIKPMSLLSPALAGEFFTASATREAPGVCW